VRSRFLSNIRGALRMKTHLFSFPTALRLGAAVVLLAALAACNGSSSGTGSLTVGVTDTPVDGLSQVTVAFTGIELMGPDGMVNYSLQNEASVNLLTLQGTQDFTVLANQSVPAGDYQWMRLDIDPAHSYVVTDLGTQYPLSIPSGSETGLKLVSGFTVAQGSLSSFVIDFNLRQSLTEDNQGGTTTYSLTPALRIVNQQEVGQIAGSVSSNLDIGTTPISATGCDPAVYVYSGTPSVLEGYDATVSGGTMPLTSATLSLDTSTGVYGYTVGFLAPGTYTLTVTCAGDDVSGGTFVDVTPVTTTVSTDVTTTLNFS
jgi:hypothetical protein